MINMPNPPKTWAVPLISTIKNRTPETSTNLSLPSTLQYADCPGHNVAWEKKSSSTKQEKLLRIDHFIKLCNNANVKIKLNTNIPLTEKKVEASSSSSAFGRARACLNSRSAINCQEVLTKMLRTIILTNKQ